MNGAVYELESTMRAKQVFVLCVLALGSQGVAQASPYPADAEANHHLASVDTYADQQARIGQGGASWGVSKRQPQPHDPFPFGGGYIDD
jgi:hypothetical protein